MKVKMERTFWNKNRPPPETTANILPEEKDFHINSVPPTAEEIRKAIKSIHNGKSGWSRLIHRKAIKYAKERNVNTFHPFFEKTWHLKTIPEEWIEGVLFKLPKRMTWVCASIKEESYYCLHLVKFSTKSYWKEWKHL